MSRTAAPVLLSAVFLLSLSAASAFNITLLLSRYPGYETFNDLLSKTNLAREINRRSTITILALTNDSMAPIAAKTEEVQTRILSNHVVLDYYDNLKLNKLKNTKTVLTTLFQASGTANGQQGFLAVVHRKDGSIVFGSAVKGAPLVSILEGSVAAQPYNISVLAVSQPIIGPGIDGEWVPVAEAPAPAKKKASPPPAASPVEDEVVADAPAPEEAVPAPAPAEAPGAEAPAADADADDGSSPVPKSGAGKGAVSGVTFGLVVALISLVAA